MEFGLSVSSFIILVLFLLSKFYFTANCTLETTTNPDMQIK